MDKKRILALFLALTMVFSLALPGMAFADEGLILIEEEGEAEAAPNAYEEEIIDEEALYAQPPMLSKYEEDGLLLSNSPAGTITVTFMANGEEFTHYAEEPDGFGSVEIRVPDGTPEPYYKDGFRYEFQRWTMGVSADVAAEPEPIYVNEDTTVTAAYTPYPDGEFLVTYNNSDGFLSDIAQQLGVEDYTQVSVSKWYEMGVTIGEPYVPLKRGVGSTAPTVIASAQDLRDFADAVNGGYNYAGVTVELMTDNIDLSSEDWTPIGVIGVTGDTLDINPGNGAPTGDNWKSFSGTFEGNNHAITGLSGNLFNAINGATIENLVINGAYIDGGDLVGALTGYAYGSTIDSVDLTGVFNISGTHFVGGLIGYAASTDISSCDVTASVASGAAGSRISAADDRGEDGDDVGGLIGYFGPSATLSNCTVNGYDKMTVSGLRQVGGLAGLSSAGGTITDCEVTNLTVECATNAAASQAKEDKIAFGGMVGAFNSSCGAVSGTVTYVTLANAEGAVTDNMRGGFVTGGVYDRAKPVTLPTLNVTASSCTMEVSSQAQLATIAANVNSGAENYAGHVIELTSDITLSGFWTPIGSAAGANIYGGDGAPRSDYNYFAGTFRGNDHTISRLDVRGDTDSEGLGLFGAVNGATISDLTIQSPYISGSGDFVGALVGYAYNSSIVDVDVLDAVGNANWLKIMGNHFVGGAVGFASKTTLYNVDVVATETSSFIQASDVGGQGEDGDDVGGVAGYTVNNTTLTNCDVSGRFTVSAVRQGGGLVGLLSAGSTVNNCTVSGITVVCDVTDAAMNKKGTTKVLFGGLAGGMNGSVSFLGDCDVSYVNLAFDPNVTSSAIRANSRMGYFTGGTYASSTFAVTDTSQILEGTATINNVAKPSDSAPVAEASALIDGLPVYHYKNPEWRWIAKSDGGFDVIAYFACIEDSERSVTKTSVDHDITVAHVHDDTNHKTTYTASVVFVPDGKTYTSSRTVDDTFSVWQNGTQIGNSYRWGEVVTLTTTFTSAKWYIIDDSHNNREITLAYGRSYTFPVTEDINVQVVASDQGRQAVASSTLKANGDGTLTFHAKWSVPGGQTVTDVTIYRAYNVGGRGLGYESGTQAPANPDELINNGTPMTLGSDMRVNNGDYTLTITGLPIGYYQNAQLKVTYSSGASVVSPLGDGLSHAQNTLS